MQNSGTNNVPAAIEFTVGANIELASGISIDMTAAANNLTIKNGAGTLTLDGAVTFDVTTGKTLSITEAVDNSGNDLTVQGAGNTTISGVVSGTGQVIKNGAGILTLSAASNTFSGNLTVSAGTVSLNNTTAPLAAGVISMSGGILLLNQAINAANWNRTITFTGGATIQSAAASEIDADITNGGILLTITGTENLTISSIIGSGAGGVTVNMTALADVVTLSGANTYTGATTVDIVLITLFYDEIFKVIN
ncbi:MAG: autotransporter-associated beta strand repeat-containing protein [Thermotogota bacterium]|nr:autotransporter-associated beta strand repeat-containing protein [Thermotogota bacterium]